MKVLLEAKVIGSVKNEGEDNKEFPYLIMLESKKVVQGLDFPDTQKCKSVVKAENGMHLFEVRVSCYDRNIYYKILSEQKKGG